MLLNKNHQFVISNFLGSIVYIAHVLVCNSRILLQTNWSHIASLAPVTNHLNQGHSQQGYHTP